jgi:23S rRNA (guanosine2251-2'-O)-methyltransferase
VTPLQERMLNPAYSKEPDLIYTHKVEIIFCVRKCVNPGCGLRYTLLADDPHGKRCPVCRSATEVVGENFLQQDIPVFPLEPSFRLEILLDNIRSAWNVGSILRAADGAGVSKVHLCGVSPLPDQVKVTKTALGAERSLPWEYHPDGVEACGRFLSAGYRLWGLEGGARAENLYQVTLPASGTLLLVVGNEVTGVDPGILALCEQIVCLPMLGSKGSLNVAGAFAAAVYALRFRDQERNLRR